MRIVAPSATSHPIEEARIAKLEASLEALVANPVLLEEARFRDRAAALDYLEFELLDVLRASLDLTTGAGPGRDGGADPDLLQALLSRAEEHRDRLDEIDRILFERLRRDLRNGLRGEALRTTLSRYVGPRGSMEARLGYDYLDDFLAGLFLPPPVPEASRPLEAGMVFYQPTPARVILELVDGVRPGRDQLFVDIGSGLGLVPILVHLLTGVRTLGIEVDPAYCGYAAGRAGDLGIEDHVEFCRMDAREADFGESDVIFLYTPFVGAMLDHVLSLLRDQCRQGVRLFSYGPCTATVARQPWLEPVGPVDSPERLAMFKVI